MVRSTLLSRWSWADTMRHFEPSLSKEHAGRRRRGYRRARGLADLVDAGDPELELDLPSSRAPWTTPPAPSAELAHDPIERKPLRSSASSARSLLERESGVRDRASPVPPWSSASPAEDRAIPREPGRTACLRRSIEVLPTRALALERIAPEQGFPHVAPPGSPDRASPCTAAPWKVAKCAAGCRRGGCRVAPGSV